MTILQKNSQTYKNLLAAFKEESKSHTKYKIYSDKALSEGYTCISESLSHIADNEKHHAEIYLKYLTDNTPTTFENLQDAVSEENTQATVTYRQFSRAAKEEGYYEIARLFRQIAAIEKQHEAALTAHMESLDMGTVFSSPNEITWVCGVCGNEITSTDAPRACPVCARPQANFAMK